MLYEFRCVIFTLTRLMSCASLNSCHSLELCLRWCRYAVVSLDTANIIALFIRTGADNVWFELE